MIALSRSLATLVVAVVVAVLITVGVYSTTTAATAPPRAAEPATRVATLAQAVKVCRAEVRANTDPNFDAYISIPDTRVEWMGIPLATFRFGKCLATVGHPMILDTAVRVPQAP